jgi:MOSC domain-containing protein YiiM
MQTAPRHLTTAELEQHLPDVLASPKQAGRLEAIVVRPASNQRRTLATARLTPEAGIEGDRWINGGHAKLADGRPDTSNQVSLMNVRFLQQIAGHQEAICLAGDNLIVDLDLGEANLPAGSRLAIGEHVVIELTAQPHTGCTKFASRYGNEARAFMNNERGTELHLRGRYARVATCGTIAVGDAVRKLAEF